MDHEQWNDRYATTDLLWSAGPNQFVARETSDLPPGRALDVACGEGRNAIWLAERGWNVTAVDFSEVAIDRGRETAKRRGVEVEWHVADVRKWEPKTGYDLVAVCYLQLPAAEREPLWRSLAGALSPGGTLLVIAHDARNIADGYGGPQYPEVLCTAAEITAHLRDLEVVRAGEEVRAVGLESGETAHAIDCLVRARRSHTG